MMKPLDWRSLQASQNLDTMQDPYCDSMASSSLSFPNFSSISSTRKWKYDVFLSFNGEDTRNTATDFIYYALQQKGIRTFKDDEKLEKGKTIESELVKAIKESRFAVVILSENYASSTWCLNEVAEIIECEKMGMTVLPIFYNVDPSDVRKQKGTFANDFVKHEEKVNKETVEKWRYALRQVANIDGWHVKNSRLSIVVESIVGLISRNPSYRFSEVIEGLVGIDSRMEKLESCLASELCEDVRFIGIWAMGGMGKTTLAKVAYSMLSEVFEANCFIENVREKCEKDGLLSLQENLISQISKETNLSINNSFDGVYMIKNMLHHKRSLLVLDDVNQSNQLEMLAGKRDWFGPGSRIIITTRNKHLLKTHSLDDTEICEVKALNYDDALRLFCSKAFKKEPIPYKYLELSKGFLKYVDGLPLTLEVLGSFLYGKCTTQWENALEMLKEDPKHVNRVLKISYDGLHDTMKEIFLDIACFFNHEAKDNVVQILEILGRYSRGSRNGLSIFVDNSLLRISVNNKLWMHDLVRDMGRNIVHQESPNDPGKRSRLWLYEDITHVLKNNMGSKKVQAIDIRGVEDTSIYREEKEACWGWVLSALPWQGLALLVTLRGWVQKTLSWLGFTSSKKQKGPLWNANAFSKLSNLKFLRIRNICPQQVPKHLPNTLRYLDWSDYPAKSLPCFQPDELVQLCLPRSKIELLWGGMKNFDRLKFIDMAGSLDLIIAPNFEGVPNIEKLVLARCSNLCKLHPSIGKLKNLKLLDLEECQELASLPNKFEMESLVTLNLTRCSKVKKIPEFSRNMKHLQELFLECTAITELPLSVECLTGLNILILRDCKQLVCLPNTICSLTLLNTLDLFGCQKFDKLPEDLGNIVSLKKLYLSTTAIKELPSSVEFLTGLTSLDLTDCKDFVLLPSIICSLTLLNTLDLSGCKKFDKLPEDLGNIVSLKKLFLSTTAIKELPSSVEFLTGLTSLDLTDCKDFVLLPSTICSLKSLFEINLYGCSKFVNLPENLGNLEGLVILCLVGTEIEVLPSTIGRLTALAYLHINDCKNLVCLPDDIGCLSSLQELHLCGNDFVSLPKSISQLSRLVSLNLDGCKRLRSLPDIPSQVYDINVNNCTSLERFPEGPKPQNDLYRLRHFNFCVRCINCFNMDYSIQIGSNIPRGQSGKILGRFPYIFPGKEIPNGFEKVNIRDNSVNIQLPRSGFDELEGTVLCFVVAPSEYSNHYGIGISLFNLDGLRKHSDNNGNYSGSEYGKLESHHLWLQYLSFNSLPGRSIDEKGFHQVGFTIVTQNVVETVGFCLVNKRDVEDSYQ